MRLVKVTLERKMRVVCVGLVRKVGDAPLREMLAWKVILVGADETLAMTKDTLTPAALFNGL